MRTCATDPSVRLRREGNLASRSQRSATDAPPGPRGYALRWRRAPESSEGCASAHGLTLQSGAAAKRLRATIAALRAGAACPQ